MTSLSTIQETPGQSASSIVFTSGSRARIDAPADKVFGIITDYKNYSQWNSWTPIFEFEDAQFLHVGSQGVLTTMSGGSELKIPLKIIEYSSTPTEHILAWRASYLPSWFAVAERVHVVRTVTPATTDEGNKSCCEIRQWESMSGWGAYLLKYLMGVPKQLDEANLRYMQELRSFAESS